MAEATVRDAAAPDLAALAELHVQTWLYAYSEVLPPDVLAALDPAQVAEGLRAALDGPVFLVGEEGGTPVGYCIAGAAPPEEVAAADGALPDDAASVGQVAGLLVAPRWARRGHGGRLLAEAAGRLRAGGASRAITWVPEADVALVSFYERAGWPADGLVRTLNAGGSPIREVRMTGPVNLRVQ